MRRFGWMVVAASLAFALAAMAADPWKEKAPEQWSQSEVKKILSDSPWSRPYEVMQQSISGSLGSGNDMLGGSGGASAGGGGKRSRSGNDDSLQNGHFITYVAQWYSSRTVRAAQLRKAIFAGSTPGPDHPLHQVPDSYQVVLQSPDLSLFAKFGEGLKKTTYIEMKRTHQRIAPSQVFILQGNGGRPMGVAFEFPKKTATGEPTVAADEKGIEFVSGTDDLKLRFRFDLAKMIDQKGADL